MKKTGPVKHFYTLVELLVVVALAAILFGIGLPAFNVLTKGNSMTSSINDRAGKIKATRAYAVANNCYTAIIFPCAGNDDGLNMDKLDASLWNRACRPCVVYPRDNESSWVFDSWIDGENWLTLGNNVIFSKVAARVASGTNVAFVYSKEDLVSKEIWNVKNNYSNGNYDDKFIIPKDSSIYLDINKEDLDGFASEKVRFRRIMIFRPNGQLLENVFLTLQEGTNTGTEVVETQAEGERVYYALGVNKYNGKITYYDPVQKDQD